MSAAEFTKWAAFNDLYDGLSWPLWSREMEYNSKIMTIFETIRTVCKFCFILRIFPLCFGPLKDTLKIKWFYIIWEDHSAEVVAAIMWTGEERCGFMGNWVCIAVNVQLSHWLSFSTWGVSWLACPVFSSWCKMWGVLFWCRCLSLVCRVNRWC